MRHGTEGLLGQRSCQGRPTIASHRDSRTALIPMGDWCDSFERNQTNEVRARLNIDTRRIYEAVGRNGQEKTSLVVDTGIMGDSYVAFALLASPWNRRLAVSYCRSGFALLRTACSLPVALNPASQRRSYLQLRGSWHPPGADSHHTDRAPSRAHNSGNF